MKKPQEKDVFDEDRANQDDEIILAASTYKTLEDVGVRPTPRNMKLYQKIKMQNALATNAGKGVILPN